MNGNEYTEVPTRAEFTALQEHTQEHCVQIGAISAYLARMCDGVKDLAARQDEMLSHDQLATVMFNMQVALLAATTQRIGEQEGKTQREFNLELYKRALIIASERIAPEKMTPKQKPLGEAINQANELTIEGLKRRIEQFGKVKE